MADLTPEETSLSTSGLNPTYNTAASGGDTFANDGRTYIHVKNGHASAARTVTVTNQGDISNLPGYGDLSISDVALSVPAQGERILGPFPKSRFNNSSNKVALSYSDSGADITLAVVKLKHWDS